MCKDSPRIWLLPHHCPFTLSLMLRDLKISLRQILNKASWYPTAEWFLNGKVQANTTVKIEHKRRSLFLSASLQKCDWICCEEKGKYMVSAQQQGIRSNKAPSLSPNSTYPNLYGGVSIIWKQPIFFKNWYKLLDSSSRICILRHKIYNCS